MKHGCFADTEEKPGPHTILPIGTFSPHQVAQWIRSLDSQLLAIAGKRDNEALVLCYTFAVAGQVQTFCTKVSTAPLFSIADLYPAAVAFEAALQQQWEIVFQPYHQGRDEH